MTLWDEKRETEPEPRREREGGRLVFFLVVGLVLLLAGGYVAAYLAAGDKVPRGTTVAGVDIGGLTPAAACVRPPMSTPATVVPRGTLSPATR